VFFHDSGGDDDRVGDGRVRAALGQQGEDCLASASGSGLASWQAG
jgi:hypothetical protein